MATAGSNVTSSSGRWASAGVAERTAAAMVVEVDDAASVAGGAAAASTRADALTTLTVVVVSHPRLLPLPPRVGGGGCLIGRDVGGWSGAGGAAADS